MTELEGETVRQTGLTPTLMFTFFFLPLIRPSCRSSYLAFALSLSPSPFIPSPDCTGFSIPLCFVPCLVLEGSSTLS